MGKMKKYLFSGFMIFVWTLILSLALAIPVYLLITFIGFLGGDSILTIIISYAITLPISLIIFRIFSDKSLKEILNQSVEFFRLKKYFF